ncbi:Conserved hypothetical protein [Zobellia galactanivorans]|uniref:Membrane lipoprotein n=1 Tax=Zobellia galactanivorans (strain DSM 12802 / CCUG 47099 / CIP 106680 / NCIMB 13871 / Dsij) TaxID=63186 RepID=G0L608_ZOBGA|nr:Conserved hypothetical protein [Zobellia galactanivorans]
MRQLRPVFGIAMIKFIKSILLCTLSCLTLLSCIEDQDFNQYDEIGVTPNLEASILYVEAPESLVNDTNGANIFSRNFNFDAFSSDVFAKRVLDGTITYIVENTTSKELQVTVELLDADDNVLDTEIIPVDPTPYSLQRDVAYGSSGRSIDIIKNTSSIRVTANNLGNTTSTSNEPEPKIILKSSGQFRVEIK